MDIFSKSNRSIADAAAKVMAETPAKVEDYKPKQPLNTTMVDQVMKVGISPRFDISQKTLKEDKDLVLKNPSQDPTESNSKEEGQFKLDHSTKWPNPKKPLEHNKSVEGGTCEDGTISLKNVNPDVKESIDSGLQNAAAVNMPPSVPKLNRVTQKYLKGSKGK